MDGGDVDDMPFIGPGGLQRRGPAIVLLDGDESGDDDDVLGEMMQEAARHERHEREQAALANPASQVTDNVLDKMMSEVSQGLVSAQGVGAGAGAGAGADGATRTADAETDGDAESKAHQFDFLWQEYENAQRAVEENVREGMDVYPDPSFVLKVHTEETLPSVPSRKVFVNICTSDLIEKAGVVVCSDGSEQLRIPASCEAPREDVDRKGNPCSVVDIVFHPETVESCNLGREYKDMLARVALQNIENKHNFKFVHDEYRYPKLRYKGQGPPPKHRIWKDPTRRHQGKGASDASGRAPPQPREPEVTPVVDRSDGPKPLIEELEAMPSPIEPDYQLYRSTAGGNCSSRGGSGSGSSSDVVVLIATMPLVESSAQFELTIRAARLKLTCSFYHLDLDLSTVFNESSSGVAPNSLEPSILILQAKFNKRTRQLLVRMCPNRPPTEDRAEPVDIGVGVGMETTSTPEAVKPDTTKFEFRNALVFRLCEA